MQTENHIPKVNGYTWRAIQPSDGPLLHQFELECSQIDGATNLKSSAEWNALVQEQDIQSRSIIAVNPQGKLAAAARFEIDERMETVLAFLDGRVHPDFRDQGIGTQLLAWLESEAGIRMQAIAKDRPCTFRIMFYDRAPEAVKLFEANGYDLQYVELEMTRDLNLSLPDISHPTLTFEPWSSDNQSDFYQVYRAAFHTRTDQLLSSRAWHHHFANPNNVDFQPGLSLLARQFGNPVGYIVVHGEPIAEDAENNLVWITQTGVSADYRRQGIGGAMLVETMRVLRSQQFNSVKLSVNINNPGATALYETLGFTVTKKMTMYVKNLLVN
jgi:ribosomal protein S18 acetylase RimI-like enzyme